MQLNDTHPAVAVAELMRLLVDEHSLGWDEAWKVTRAHLRLHESHSAAGGAGEMERRSLSALCCRGISRSSTRSIAVFSTKSARSFPATTPASRGCRSSMKAAPRYVRMAHLATVGSHAVNGVARAALGFAEANCAARFRGAVAGEILQRDQWRDAAAVRCAEQSRTHRA